jgi:hypothetical protein
VITIDKTLFVVADLVPGESIGATITYGSGSNCSGTGHNEVLQHIRYPDGTEATFVIMRGMSRAKAQAIAMILNAPED